MRILGIQPSAYVCIVSVKLLYFSVSFIGKVVLPAYQLTY